MNYKKALQQLTERVRPADFAAELNVSTSKIRQAALPKSQSLARPIPSGWRPVARKLAQEKAEHFRKLADRLAQDR